MGTNGIAAIGYLSQTLGFAVLSLLFLRTWRDRPLAWPLGIACVASTLSGAVLALRALGIFSTDAIIVVVEWARYVIWFVALFSILRMIDNGRIVEIYARRFGLPAAVIGLGIVVSYANMKLGSVPTSLVIGGGILASLVLVSLLEQVYRNLMPDSRTSLKYVCVALFFVAAYDLLFFLRAISQGAIEMDLWAARGYIYAIIVPILGIAGRGAEIDRLVGVRQPVAFYASTILVVGVCIAIWLIADFYVTATGENWNNVATIVVQAAAVLGTSILLLSNTIRGRARVFLTKILFTYKYDYRKEWLRFVETLSESGLDHVPRTAVRAVAPIVNSPGGIVWTQENEGEDYFPAGAWHCDLPVGQSIARDSQLVRFLRDRRWVIDLNELQAHPKHYDNLKLDSWFTSRGDFWLVVPLQVGKQLLGMIVLLKPAVAPSLNFEDHDLLRTVGCHVGTHIKQADSDRRLAEASQFGTYHRLSAFLMHDMNNLIAQQSLVVKNAEKYRHDPKFVDDTIDTIAHSVARMRRLMAQLSGNSEKPASTKVRVRDIVEKAAQRSDARQPVPTLRFDCDDVHLMADSERLTVVIEHLIRNAQDASEPDGSIEVTTTTKNGIAVIAICDAGCGMTPEFISERLFRPFDSTKGSQSMGIGVYQAREYARMLGGTLEVESRVGEGTTFMLRLPVTK